MIISPQTQQLSFDYNIGTTLTLALPSVDNSSNMISAWDFGQFCDPIKYYLTCVNFLTFTVFKANFNANQPVNGKLNLLVTATTSGGVKPVFIKLIFFCVQDVTCAVDNPLVLTLG